MKKYFTLLLLLLIKNVFSNDIKFLLKMITNNEKEINIKTYAIKVY